MRKEFEIRKKVDKYLLQNFNDLSGKKDWKKLADIFSKLHNLPLVDNDYFSIRYGALLNKIKRGKSVEMLLNEIILPPLSKSEKRAIYNKKYLESDKGKAMKEKMAKNSWHIRNREYRRIKDKEYREKNKDKEKIRARKNQIRLYNITEEEYNNMFEQQNGCCSICGLHQSNFKKSFHIDHCHKTNKVRGLLCRNCNVGLGHFKDSVELMNKAINYLNK